METKILNWSYSKDTTKKKNKNSKLEKMKNMSEIFDKAFDIQAVRNKTI